MGLKGGSTTQTTTVDGKTQAYQDAVRARALQLSNSGNPAYGGQVTVGPNQAVEDARSAYAGAAGYNPLAFSSANLQQFFDPYQQQVIDASNADFGQIQNKTLGAINDQATKSGGAFGSRRDVAQGAALGELGRGQQANLAALRSAGYGQAVNQFNQQNATGLQGQYARLAGAGGLLNVGQFQTGVEGQNLQNLYNEWLRQQNVPYQQLQALNGSIGPAGQTSTVEKKGSVLGTIAGLGAIAAAPFTGGQSLGFAGLLGGGVGNTGPNGWGGDAVAAPDYRFGSS